MKNSDLSLPNLAKEFSFPKEKIKILFLEGIHESAVQQFESSGYHCRCLPGSLSESELIAEITDVHILGIRSKSGVTSEVLNSAKSLLSIGCFCIGVNQVALEEAQNRGIPVFNAPFSNTRSVAELTIGNMIMLARKAAERSNQMHLGKWDKSANNCYELRGKTVGIIGYGNIGPQVGLLCEAFGMKVIFYDIVGKLSLGNAQQISSLDEVLAESDFITLHVPETNTTKGMIGVEQLRKMKVGSYLINLSRGTVVDIVALREALISGHLLGAAIDVFPDEPKSNNDKFSSPLQNLPNVILTPHIGAATVEAQRNIGREVSDSLLRFIETGTSTGAVNFPNIDLPVVAKSHRVLNIHVNKPGILGNINQVIADLGANIEAQYLATSGGIGYLIMDIDSKLSRSVKDSIDQISGSIKTRLLF
jgi:D-3-phosphoglycerate dehydrogenase / 2-oxoglutarate reductase